MPIDPEKLTALQAIIKPQVAEILKVEWSDSVTKYYAITGFDELTPFQTVKNHLDGGTVEARLLNEQFHAFEINGDVRDEEIPFIFWNADKVISGLFETHGEGVKCELFYFYPQVGLFISVWWGQLSQPKGDYKQLNIVASNGFSSPEQHTPGRTRPPQCVHNFGGHFTDADTLKTNGCPYDRQLGGSEGLLNGAVPFTSCPRISEADCTTRFGHTRYYGGWKWKTGATVTDPRIPSGSIAKGSGAKLKTPIRVIAGAKYVRNAPILFFRRELNPSDPEKGFVRIVAEVGEGQVDQVFNPVINEKKISPVHVGVNYGHRGQSPLGGWNGIPNYSNTALLSAAYGWVDPNTVNETSLELTFVCHGYNKVRIYTDEDSYTEAWSNSRVWWLLEFYTHQRFGRKYEHSRFWIEHFITAHNWTYDYVRFTAPNAQNFDGYRTLFDAVIEGRSTKDVITDICRSGRLSVPFQYEGKYTIVPLRKATTDELNNAKVFTDRGDSKNIIFADGQPSLRKIKVSDKDLVNEVVLEFEDISIQGVARPITVKDLDQAARAGKAVGENSFVSRERRYAGFGISREVEAIKLAFGLLWFGEFDEGGVKNNLRVPFTTTYEQVLGIKKYDVIKIESDELANEGYTEGETFTQFEYFRILHMKKRGDNLVDVTAQAYNQAAYATFEVAQTPVGTPNTPTTVIIFGNTCNPTFTSATYENGRIEATIEPC